MFIIAVIMIPERRPLPYHKALGRIPLRFDVVDISRVDEVHQLYKEAADSSMGYTSDETTWGQIYHAAKHNFGVMVYDERTDEVVCCCLTKPSMTYRSAKPLCGSAFAVVKKSHNGKGIHQEIHYIYLNFCYQMEYLGKCIMFMSYEISYYTNIGW